MPVALERIRDQLSKGADAVQDAALRLRSGLASERARQQLEDELDRLFSELGVEVYQRISRGDPVEESVVVEDLIDQIEEVEQRLENATGPA